MSGYKIDRTHYPKKQLPTTLNLPILLVSSKVLQKVGLENKFLANIREVDAIVHACPGAFDDENVMREQGREDAFVDQSQILIPLT